MTEIGFPVHILKRFVETLSAEMGHETLTGALTNAGLPAEWAHSAHFSALDDQRAANVYSRLQSALRKYYGRGARSTLLWIGVKLWEQLLNDSAFGIKAQAAIIQRLPKGLRRKPALELLARILSATSGSVSVHSLDLDLLFVDHASPTAMEQTDTAPICFVTLGLIRECLFWAVGQEHDIEERACRVTGARQCEFKISIGGEA